MDRKSNEVSLRAGLFRSCPSQLGYGGCSGGSWDTWLLTCLGFLRAWFTVGSYPTLGQDG